MTTIEKIRAEIEDKRNVAGHFDTKTARAQVLALSWVIYLIDKYAEQEPKVTTTSTDEPMVIQYPQVDGITPTVVKAEQEPCEDCLFKKEWEKIGKLISVVLKKQVEQEQKTGHWIETDEWCETVDGFEQWGYFRKCSKCGYVFKFLEIDNYCPNCGLKMVESQESGYKE